LLVIYSIINNDAKPTIAALPLNRSAKRLKPNLVTTNLGWTVGRMFTMIKNFTYAWAIQYLFYGCLTRSASGISPTDDCGVVYGGFAKSLL